MAKDRRVVWVAAAATPQFVPVLNRLASYYRIPLRAHYLHSGSRGRGWGRLTIQHEHHFLPGDISVVRSVFSGIRDSRLALCAVVLGYSHPYAMGMLIGCRFRRRPVFTMSDSDVGQHSRRPWYVRTAKQLWVRAAFAKGTRVWAISRSNAEFWSRMGLSNQVHIPFESRIPPLAAGARPREPSLERVVLYVGRLAPEKGIETLVDACRLLNREDVHTKLRVIGEGDSDLLGPAEARPDWLTERGSVPHAEIAAEFTNADVLAVPSLVEPYGLVVTEAMQFGLPIVATNRVPAALELCDMGWNIVPPRHPAALAAALKRALDQEERWPRRIPIDSAALYAAELVGVMGSAFASEA
jgi:glycosyltransferase involved in cell wall biosynthesis